DPVLAWRAVNSVHDCYKIVCVGTFIAHRDCGALMSKRKPRTKHQTNGEPDGSDEATKTRQSTAPPYSAPEPVAESPIPSTAESGRFPIVGIGASAGGLAALKEFFAQVPRDSGLAFVVVVHLAPEYKSHLPELLQPHVRMPVEQVSKTVSLEPNRVY